jgi:hypothetical protein
MFLEFIRDDKFGPIRHYFQIQGKNVDAAHILNKVMEINGLSPSMAERQGWDLSKVPIDFTTSSKPARRPPEPLSPATGSTHIRLNSPIGIHRNCRATRPPLQSETRSMGDHIPDQIVIGVSKGPCWCCELFSRRSTTVLRTHISTLMQDTKRRIPGGSYVESEWDRGVLRHVWNYMDRFIQTVEHIEMRDFVPSIMETPLAVWLPAGAIAQLRSI